MIENLNRIGAVATIPQHPRLEKKPMPSVILGNDEAGQGLHLGDIERRSGLYILGKPGMGKSALIVNVLNADIKHGHGAFFLDPHGDAISDLLKRGDSCLAEARLFDLENDEEFSFGINLLACRNIKSLKERTDTYTRAYNVFYKLWEDEWGPWLQLILQNTLWAFIENQEYTLAEVPMFLNPRNERFREHIIGNIKHNPAVVDFWKYEFFERRERDQQERVDAALTRITTLLTHPYVRHIIGQKKTTVDFSEHLKSQSILLFKIPANLSPDIKRFIGAILVSELLHAVRNRPENDRNQFCVFVDEFQNFATSDDFTTLITEARKFGIATTIAHVERFGQFAENHKLLGATLAAVNKVFFQLTVKDAEELAPEFAKEPTTNETRLEPELVISQEPFDDLLRRGHPNPQIMEFVNSYLRQIQYRVEDMRREMEGERLLRLDLLDEASMARVDERREGAYNSQARGRDLSLSTQALDRTEQILASVKEKTEKLSDLHKRFDYARQSIRGLNGLLTKAMEGTYYYGQENFCTSLLNHVSWWQPNEYFDIKLARDCSFYQLFQLYIALYLGDPNTQRTIHFDLAEKYGLFPEARAEIVQQREELKKKEKEYTEKRFWEAAHKAADEGVKSGKTPKRQLEDLLKGNDSYRRSEEAKRPWSDRFYKIDDNVWVPLPEHLPSRVLTQTEREAVRKACATEVLLFEKEYNFEKHPWNMEGTLKVITNLAAFCELLRKPENHIKVPSGQYVEKLVSVRLVSDMTNEMAQELANLPQFTAYAKVIDETEGKQIVLKQKIKTLPLPEPQGKAIEGQALAKAHAESQKRDEIEKEIQKRQDRWRRRNDPPSGEEPRR
jgi:hypothetical protein